MWGAVDLVRPGDILGFSGRGLISDTINVFTYGLPRWSLSHVGIIGEHKGQLLLFESTTLDSEPCAIRGKCINGTQAHEIEERVQVYDGRVWHYPLSMPLGVEARRELSRFLLSTLGISYDSIGAFRSAGLGFSWLESLLHPASLHSIFCSELCAAAHATIGVFRTENVSRWSPNLFVRTERRRTVLQSPRRLK
jgi:hypothetical protein